MVLMNALCLYPSLSLPLHLSSSPSHSRLAWPSVLPWPQSFCFYSLYSAFFFLRIAPKSV
jgi:hypothetical protein